MWVTDSLQDLDDLSPLRAEDAVIDVFSTPPQLDGDLVTLTLLPRARWQTLINLDVIQVRFRIAASLGLSLMRR